MRFGDLLEFRKDIFFDGAVQIDWFYNKEKATLVAENFVFHGSEYHGATGGSDSNLRDTVSFVQEISEKINNEYPNNPLTLAIATYGTGKSHLGVTLAELFSGPDYNPKAYNAIISNIKEIDATKSRAIEQNTQKKNLVLTINGMRDINLNAELLKVALKSLSLYGCSTENLKKINRALETASRFFERNAGNLDLFERYADSFGFYQKGEELINAIRSTLFQEETTFNLVNAAYKDINGVDISWDEGISANSILNCLLEDYCGSSGLFDSIVIIFDEFGRYLEYASNNSSAKTGESALQQIFECAQNAEGKIQVINLIQSDIKTYLQRIDPTSNISRYIGRYDVSEKYHLSSNLETIFANLVVRKDKPAFTTLVANRLQQKEEYWKEVHNSLTKWTNVRGIWKYYPQYRKVVVQGIFPMHPLSTYVLSQLSSYLQNRSSLFLVSEYFSKFKDVLIDEEHELPCVYPEQLLQGELFSEILSAEESGRQSTQFCLAFSKILAKHQDKFDESCLKLLRANLLLRVLRLKTVDRSGLINALEMFSGLSKLEIGKALELLENEYGVLGFNEHIGCFDFLEDSTGAHDFRVFFNRKKANTKITTNVLGDSVIRELADVIEPQGTRFAIDKKIKTKEWQYEQDLFSIDEMSLGYLNKLKKEFSEATTPDKPKGKLIWLYMNKDISYSNVEEVCKMVARVSDMPIVLMLLNDQDNKLMNEILNYEALRSFSTQECTKYAAYYSDMLDSVTASISDIFESLKSERICIFEDGARKLEERLPIYLSSVFERIYPKALSFDFDGFETTKGKARSLFYRILRVIFNGKIDSTTIQALGADAERRLKNTLSCSAINSWKAMNDRYQIVLPQHQQALEVYNTVANKLVLDQPISYEYLSGELLQAPYGMNDHEALYMISVVYANLSYCLRIIIDGVQVTLPEWLDKVIPVSGKGTVKIDFKKLQATSFVKKDLANLEAKFMSIFAQIENASDVIIVRDNEQKLEKLLQSEQVPEALVDKYNLINEKIKRASAVYNEWDASVSSVYRIYESLLQNKKSYDIQQTLKTIPSLDKGEIFSVFYRNNFIINSNFKDEIAKLNNTLRKTVKPLLTAWIGNERCLKREDVTNFESKMGYFSSILKDAGFIDEAKLALAHIELEKQKPWFKIESINSEFRKIDEEFHKNKIDESYGYKRIKMLQDECADILKEIGTVQGLLPNASEIMTSINNKLDILKDIRSNLDDALDNLEEQLDNMQDLDSVRIVVLSVNKLMSNDYDDDTNEYLKDLRVHLENIINILEPAGMLTNNREEFENRRLQIKNTLKSDLDYLNDEYGRDITELVDGYLESVDEQINKNDLQWREKYLSFDFANATIRDVSNLRLELETMPKFMSQESITALEEIKKKAEEYIAKDKVNAVVESFRSLNDEQRLICFKLLQGLI